MKLFFFAGLVLAAAATKVPETTNDPSTLSVNKGLHWLASVQGNDGGWGQDGGNTSYVRQGERLETSGNDVANTAVAALAMWKSGRPEFRSNIDRAVFFVIKNVDASQEEGLAVTNVTGSQIQRKLGPYVDTFFAARLLGEVDGKMANRNDNQRVRAALEKCVRKIQANQLKDGSWNISGGWAPILGTSMASQSLQVAAAKGVRVDKDKQAKVDQYTANALKAEVRPVTGDARGRTYAADAASAGVPLYSKAQQLEQLSRSEGDRAKNAPEIKKLRAELSDERVLNGFGSMGGEEFFSYLNVADSLHRTGGNEWTKWNSTMKQKLVSLQNNDGTWAGHHCITGRVAVTSAAILTMQVEKEQAR